MPIPPRPIPNPNATHKPGSSVPRKSLLSHTHHDWRSEIALLPQLQLHPSSLPSSKGVGLIKEKQVVRDGVVRGGREVDVGMLLSESLGKREKRVTTATTLGFDFIPNPTILALPDTTMTSTRTSVSVSAARSLPSHGGGGGRLVATPSTPALVPEDEGDEGWEHIDSPELDPKAGDDDDLIMIGEMEMEMDVDLEQGQGQGHGIKAGLGVGALKTASYAAVAAKSGKAV